MSLVCSRCYISAELVDGYLDGSPPQQLIKQDNSHRPSFGVAFALQKENGGSEGELNRRLGAQKSPSIGYLTSHVFSVDADGDIARQLHTPAILRGGLCASGSDSQNIVGNV